MANSLSLLSRFKAFFAIFLLVAIVFITVPEAWAKRPPEIRNQDDLNIRKDMHGEDLSGYEFVKFDLRGIDFSNSNLTGAVFIAISESPTPKFFCIGLLLNFLALI